MSNVKFKVVNKNDGSCLIHPSSQYYVEYIKNELAIAPYGTIGLMVFKRLKDAVEWVRYMSGEAQMIRYELDNRSKILKRITHTNQTPIKSASTWNIKRVLPRSPAEDYRTIKMAKPLGIKENRRYMSSKTLDRFYMYYEVEQLETQRMKEGDPKAAGRSMTAQYNLQHSKHHKVTMVMIPQKLISCYQSVYVID